MKNIIFICGELCSGKSTLSRSYSHLQNKFGETTLMIEVSDVVKRILKKENREDLQGHPELDREIIQYIKEANRAGTVIVSGCRQVSILESFPHATLLWIDTSYNKRFERFQKSRKDVDKSEIGFLAAMKRDNKLGLTAVKEYILTRNK